MYIKKYSGGFIFPFWVVIQNVVYMQETNQIALRSHSYTFSAYTINKILN